MPSTAVSVADNPSTTQIQGRHAGRTAPALPTVPSMGSRHAHWEGCVLERHQLLPGELAANVLPANCFALPLGPTPVDIHWQLNGRPVTGQMRTGLVYLRAQGDELSSRWSQPLDALFFTLDDAFLGRALGDGRLLQPAVSARLTSCLRGRDDGVLRHMTMALMASLLMPAPRSRLFEQSLLRAMALHLWEHYGVQGDPEGVSPRLVGGRPLKARPLAPPMEPLSPRETEVLNLVARGFSHAEVAHKLGIGVATVQTHVRSLYGKLDVHSKTEAVFEARHLGLLK